MDSDGDLVIRAAAAAAYVRGVSAKGSHAGAVAIGYAGTLAEWAKLRGRLTEDELAEAARTYAETWVDVPLAAKKRRVEELALLYDRLIARLARLEATERTARRAVRKAAAGSEAAKAPARAAPARAAPARVVAMHSPEWVRTAAEARAVLRDISLEMGGDVMPKTPAELEDAGLATSEALYELQALITMEVARRKGRAEAGAEAERVTALENG